jgi:PAS domain S-box-containing protein
MAQKPLQAPNNELETLRQRVSALEKQTGRLERTKRDLTERVKELHCINSLSRLSEDEGLSSEEYLQSAVDLIPPAFQRPESTWARLTLDQKEFKTKGFQETEWRLSSEIVIGGLPSGRLEVFTIPTKPEEDTPFLAEEGNLLDLLAKSIGRRLERGQLGGALDQIAWMLSQKPAKTHDQYFPTYGDLRELNKQGLIINAVGKDQLVDIVSDYLDLLGTSAAIYERDGNYALGLFASDWCRMMDLASRELCQTGDNAQALSSGLWRCHESCWKDASLQAIKTQKPVDTPCLGGLRLYAVPIFANDAVVGAINFGYGSPPKDEETLGALSQEYQLPLETLRKEAHAYQARPQFIIDYAKNRLQKAANYLGVLIEYAQSRKQLQASTDNLQAIINASPLAIISIDAQGLVKTWNPAAERIFGWSEEEVVGQFLPIVGQEEREEFFDLLNGYQQAETTFQRNVLRTKKNGSKIMTRLSTAIIQNEEGELISVIGILEDITEQVTRTRQHQQLLNQQFTIHELALTLGDAHDLQTIYRAVHHHLADILGIQSLIITSLSKNKQNLQLEYFAYGGAMLETAGTPQISVENLNCPLIDVLQNKHLVTIPDWQKNIAAEKNKADPMIKILPFHESQEGLDEVQFKKSLGSVVLIPVNDEDEIIGIIQVSKPEATAFSQEDLDFLANIANITAISIQKVRLIENLEGTVAERTAQLEAELKKSERSQQAMLYMVEDLNQSTRELNLEQEKLARLNKELEAFSYSVSHDLRAPLRHINGYIELLLKRFPESLPEKAQHYLDNIVESANEMGVLIDDLLNFSRTGRQEIHPTIIDMNALVQEVKTSLQQDLTQRSIAWEIPDLPPAFGDRNLIKLVWRNLLSNAVKFTKTKPQAKISIGFQEKNEQQIYFVKDNGVGFDMAYEEKLFGLFQRLHPATDFEGTGIGLANVRRIIERHGGRAWAEGDPGRGACFYFSLPKKEIVNETA